MDFKRLGYFAQVAELGSLSRASEHLRITQPSLSRQMRLLEEELGVKLFLRGPHGMDLTGAGDLLYSRTAGPLREIGHALYEVRSLTKNGAGAITVGLPSTLIGMLVGPLLQQAADTVPDIALRFVEGEGGTMAEAMREGRVDIAILYGPTPSRLNAAKLAQQDLCLVSANSSSLGCREAIDFEQIGACPLVVRPAGDPLRQLIEAEAGRQTVKLDIVHSVESLAVMKELVGAGLGHAILPRCAIERDIAAGQFQVTQIRRPALAAQMFLALRPEASAPRTVLRVEALIRQCVASLIDQGGWRGASLCVIGDA